MDAVAAAARASKATLYRRWTSKAALVIDALKSQKEPQTAPDTGTLRGDLLGMFCGMGGLTDHRQTTILASVITAIARDQDFAEAFRRDFIGPKAALSHLVFDRARDRGEVRDDVDLDLVVAALPGHRPAPPVPARRDPRRRRHRARRRPDHPARRRRRAAPDHSPHDRPPREGPPMTDLTKTEATLPPDEGDGGGGQHLGWALVLISVAQLMVVLDGTIANIAIPYIASDLEFDPANISWIVTGYALAFGGLLLLGGRLGDLYGRRRMFMIGLVVFAVASRPRRPRAPTRRCCSPPARLQGARRRAGRPRRARADHHDVPGRPGAQPRLRRVRRHVRCRRGRRPHPRRLAHRPRPRDSAGA